MNLPPAIPPAKILRLFYAASLLAFGIQHVLFKTFITGRPMPWPEGLAGETIVAYTSGVILILSAIAIIVNRKTTSLLIVVGVMILLWAGLRNLLHVVTTLDTGATLTNMGKALTLGSGALLMAYSASDNNRLAYVTIICRYCTGLFLLFSGIQHFLYADFVKFLVPAWIPASLFITYFSGIALAVAGLSLITGIRSKLSAWLAGAMILLWVLVLHLPRAIEFNNQNEWTAVFEALAVSGILFLLSYIAERVKS